MNGIEKKSNLKPVSFDNGGRGLTKGQQMLLNLLSEKLKNNEPITKEDVTDLYINVQCPKRRAYRYGQLPDGTWGMMEKDIDNTDWTMRYSSRQWFKNNLGSCIVKGKLLAIPVIDISE